MTAPEELTIAGFVVDEHGRPMAGREVMLSRAATLVTCYTDEVGKFAFLVPPHDGKERVYQLFVSGLIDGVAVYYDRRGTLHINASVTP